MILLANVHEIYHITSDPEDPDTTLATPAQGPVQLRWDSRVPEEIVIVLGDGEFSLARERFFTEEDFPEGAVSSVMGIGSRLVFRLPADEPAPAHLLMTDNGEAVKAWVWGTHTAEAAEPAPAHDLDAELARLLEGTL